jgi:acetolactate synthase I/II/III large subunit
VAALRDVVETAERPFVLVGGGRWDSEACAHLADWAGACRLAVAAAFRRQDVLDNEHEGYAGDAGPGINPRPASGSPTRTC